MTVIAVIISLFAFHGLRGVREGTIIASLLIGFFVKQYRKIFAPAERALFAIERERQ